MNLEAITALIETNAELAQTNREIWGYIRDQRMPNLDNYKLLVKAVEELVSTLEKHHNRDLVHEGSYRYLKEILLAIKNTDKAQNQ